MTRMFCALKKNTNFIKNIIVAIIILCPLMFELEYLIYPFFYRNYLPLPSFIFSNLVIPLFSLVILFITYFKKRKINIFLFIYTLIIFIFIYLHNKSSEDLFELLKLTYNFSYNSAIENQYSYILFLPILLFYTFNELEIDRQYLINMFGFVSIVLSIIIVISNFLLISLSTYSSNYTTLNFLSWFNEFPKDMDFRLLTSRFYFKEGNTLSAYLLMLYPYVILLFFKISNKLRLLFFIFVVIQSLAMFIIGTRIATFGSVLIIGFTILIVYFDKYLNNRVLFLKLFIALLLVQLVVLPFSPAIKNQLNNYNNNSMIQKDDWIRLDFANEIDSSGLDSDSDEYYFYYLNIIEDYKWLLTIPKDYYYDKYSFYYDPKFYVDLIFKNDLINRQSSRQFQKIFYNYKWENLSFAQKLFGMGYSRFYTGSIVLEQDFVLHYYTYGVFGVILLLVPLLYYIYLIIKGLFTKEIKSDISLYYMLLSIFLLFTSAYFSGHVLDKLVTTTSVVLVMANISNNSRKSK